MADAGPIHEPYLGRLHMRFGKGSDYALPFGKTATRSQDELLKIYKDKDRYIRSKYKGRKELRGFGGFVKTAYTSGVPIYGNSDAADRSGWSVGHTRVAHAMTEDLREEAQTTKISSENSHALGHADYGVDHILSAPSASKAQNTEQLAIELAMRKAAQDLNAKYGLTGDQTMVHMKITDVLHPETGQLEARRLKLIRTLHPSLGGERVVFDHLMDGKRLHISQDEAFGLGKHVYDKLTAPIDKVQQAPKASNPTGLMQARKGSGGVKAPTGSELKAHQEATLATLQYRRRQLKAEKGQFASVDDRSNVQMVGPAHTEVSFPVDKKRFSGAQTLQGDDALEELRYRLDERNKDGRADDFWTSGSLPAGNDTKMQRAMDTLTRAFGDHISSVAAGVDFESDEDVHPLGEVDPAHTKHVIKGLQAKGANLGNYQNLAAHYDAVHATGGNRMLLKPEERQMLKAIRSIRPHVPMGGVMTMSRRFAAEQRLHALGQ